MPDTVLDQTVASLSVGEFAELFAATNGNDMQPIPSPIRDIDTIIAEMEATGKYSKKFLVSLRKGMECSQTFQRAKVQSDLARKFF